MILLADVLEEFRNISLKSYGLCQPHYLSAPNLGWSARLSMTKVELEIASDTEMYLFFDKGTSGRVS